MVVAGGAVDGWSVKAGRGEVDASPTNPGRGSAGFVAEDEGNADSEEVVVAGGAVDGRIEKAGRGEVDVDEVCDA